MERADRHRTGNLSGPVYGEVFGRSSVKEVCWKNLKYSIDNKAQEILSFFVKTVKNSTNFVYFNWRSLWICYGTRCVHIIVPQEEEVHYSSWGDRHIHSAAKSSKRFKPLTAIILLCQDHCWIGKKTSKGFSCAMMFIIRSSSTLQLRFSSYLIAIAIYNHLQKILEKLRKLRKSCNHKRNINRIYNEKLHINCLQQLPTLRLTI